MTAILIIGAIVVILMILTLLSKSNWSFFDWFALDGLFDLLGAILSALFSIFEGL